MMKEMNVNDLENVNGGDLVSCIVSGIVAGVTIALAPVTAPAAVVGGVSACAAAVAYEKTEKAPRVDYNDQKTVKEMFNKNYWRHH